MRRQRYEIELNELYQNIEEQAPSQRESPVAFAKWAAGHAHAIGRRRPLSRDPYQEMDPGAFKEVYHAGYDHGVRDGHYEINQLQEQLHRARQLGASPQELERAHARGYVAGVQEGRRISAMQPQHQQSFKSPDQIKKELLEQVYDKCKIISESNPNMAPGVKAVERMIKKI